MFHYFDLAYAEQMLQAMAKKSRKSIVILVVPNAATREAAERIRRDLMTPEEYAQKYDGLAHHYYEPQWFTQQARRLGLSCEFIENQIPNYAQKDFRFGCVMRK